MTIKASTTRCSTPEPKNSFAIFSVVSPSLKLIVRRAMSFVWLGQDQSRVRTRGKTWERTLKENVGVLCSFRGAAFFKNSPGIVTNSFHWWRYTPVAQRNDVVPGEINFHVLDGRQLELLVALRRSPVRTSFTKAPLFPVSRQAPFQS